MLIKFLTKISFILLITGYIYSQDCKAIVEITTGTDSALIYIDSKFISFGKASLELPVGKYSVKVKRDRYEWNTDEKYDSIFISDCNRKYAFQFTVNKKRVITSEPDDASIFSKDELIGYTPTTIDANINSIFAKKNEEKIEVNSINAITPVSFSKIPTPKNGSFAESDLLKILVGSAVALGTVAAYYKIQADQLYDDYKKNRLKDNLDKVNRYDLYSGIAFGILQINFGYLIYRFLSD